MDAVIYFFEAHLRCDTGMYVENDQLIIENVLREELNEGGLAASCLPHYDDGNSRLHP
jgi:hypothetical protein